MKEINFSGFAAIIGRPNVGKSTLLNHLIGQKISITSRKPQTTRHRILGIKTINDQQIIYVDTPGIHRKIPRVLNKYMNRVANSSLKDVDVILFLVEALKWNEDDEWIVNKLKKLNIPVILVVNKVDQVKEKSELLPFIDSVKEKYKFSEIIPISAKHMTNLEGMEHTLAKYLPEGPALFPHGQITDRSERFLSAEIIREKLMRFLGQELPYSLTVEIDQFKLVKGVVHIAATIFVEKAGQKKIVIGEKGEKLKQIGQQSRLDLEKLLGQKVFLQLWVKVKSGWADDARMLKSFGYTD